VGRIENAVMYLSPVGVAGALANINNVQWSYAVEECDACEVDRDFNARFKNLTPTPLIEERELRGYSFYNLRRKYF
jgi:hypothetical protein